MNPVAYFKMPGREGDIEKEREGDKETESRTEREKAK